METNVCSESFRCTQKNLTVYHDISTAFVGKKEEEEETYLHKVTCVDQDGVVSVRMLDAIAQEYSFAPQHQSDQEQNLRVRRDSCDFSAKTLGSSHATKLEGTLTGE
eukprot:766238-Hanusia_phi.AAC.5